MRSASICSVTIIEPISAAMPAPTRVASIIAGQRRAELVHQDLDELGADLREVAGDAVDLQAGLVHQHHAEEAERDADEQQRAIADLVHLAQRPRRA